MQEITITKTKDSKLSELDFNNIPLGKTFTDHMFICDYENGAWKNPRIEPMHYIPTHPATMALHYGQAIFEGMKATVNHDGTPLLFRPEKNAKRLNFSARRMGMPELPLEIYANGLKELIKIDKNWIPPQKGSALYLRPFMYADEHFIGMRAASTYKFIIICSPSGPYFSKRIKLYAEKKYIRAADGGTGEAKAAGNYAAAILPTENAKLMGYDQVLWLDAFEHKYIEEVGTMNIFFKIDGEFVTPLRDGSILDGVTRMSVIDLLRNMGFEVKERKISIDEIKEVSNNGKLEEAFGTGTAVGIAYIQDIGTEDGVIHVSDESPIGEAVNDTLNKIKVGELEDTFNWMVPVK
jgi:branched-chain amino acid aminotransferase